MSRSAVLGTARLPHRGRSSGSTGGSAFEYARGELLGTSIEMLVPERGVRVDWRASWKWRRRVSGV